MPEEKVISREHLEELKIRFKGTNNMTVEYLLQEIEKLLNENDRLRSDGRGD